MRDPSNKGVEGDRVLPFLSWRCRRREDWRDDDEGGEDQASEEGGEGEVEDDEGEEVARMQHYLTNPINRSLPSNALACLPWWNNATLQVDCCVLKES